MISPLTYIHLRFDLRARDPIKLGGARAGNCLRNALAAVMLRAVCPETPRRHKPSPEHAAVCPACWLLAHETEPGRVHRAYALIPPHPPREVAAPGERFSFVLTMFGETGLQFLPYLVLAVPQVGQGGVGTGRGRFDLESIWAGHPLAGRVDAVLKPGEKMVRVPEAAVRWSDVVEKSSGVLASIGESGRLRLRFLTPTRLIQGGQTLKLPDFGVLFRRLLRRIDELGEQFAGASRRPRNETARLHRLADRVRLVDADVRWIDLMSWSGRTRRQTPMGGLVGSAVYWSEGWRHLLPWLILGQGTQVGKSIVKGNGVFELVVPGRPGYWGWTREGAEMEV